MQKPSKQLLEFWHKGQEDLLTNHRTIYKYIDAESAIKIMDNCSLAFRNPLFFNDPYDFSLKLLDFSNIPEIEIKKAMFDTYGFLSRSDKRKLWRAGKETLKANLSTDLERLMREDIAHQGVSCFSAEYDHILMWSHYAKSHSGVCIGFNLVELFHYIAQHSHPERMVRKVIYQDELKPVRYMEQRQEATIRWMTTKSKVWQYEKEIRITLSFLDLNADHLHFQKINSDSFSSIYLGSQIDTLHEDKIREICKARYPHVTIFKMKLADDKFEMITA
jgi:hypothetical protein